MKYFSAKFWNCPKVFVSYRWGEHDIWVNDFVSDMHRKGVEVIYDRWAQDKWEFADTEEFLDKLFIAMEQCHVFIPIFTPGYIHRAGFVGGEAITTTNADDGVVFDEFEKSIVLSQYKQIETIAVLLDGSSDTLPQPFNLDNILDMRDPSRYDTELQRLVRYLHLYRAIKTKGESQERRGIITESGIRFYEE